MKKLLIFCLLQALMIAGFAQTREYLTVDGTQRTMLVYVPQNLPENAPLVITLHGFNQSAQYQMEHTAWNRVADAEKFIVVYPDYDGGWWDSNGTKDTRFIEKIMEDMNNRYKSDLSRVYVSGFSLGAMMTYHCVEVLADKVAAFAPVSGVRFDNKAPVSTRVVPIIHTHCKGDDVFKWGGDPGHASGGYPYIPDYVKSWAVYFGMNPEPEFIDPYPAEKKDSDVDLTIYRRDDSVAEVRLLSFDGAGHWHVDADGWGGVSTTWEIWNFCKRYTLNLEEVTPPRLVSISPEDKSFDLTQGHREFSVVFDNEPKAENLSAKLVGATTIDLTIAVSEKDGACVGVFAVPEGVEIPDGTYKLIIDGVSKTDDFSRAYSFEYTYGYEETGNTPNISVIFEQDWSSMYNEGESRIPEGWQRVSNKTDGTTETITSAENAGTGSRLVNIWEYGDITTGLYLTAGDLQSCNVNYGRINGSLLNLPVGRYVLSFKSAYWDKGSQRGKAVFDVSMVSKSNRGGVKTVVKDVDVKPEGCVEGENSGPIFDARYHEYTFDVEKKDNYVINFDISKPKVAVCIGGVKVTTAPSNADKYKGNFLRLYSYAEERYAELLLDLEESPSETLEAQLQTLKDALDKYKDFSSTAPSDYIAAYDELYAAVKPWIEIPVSIDAVVGDATPVKVEYFTLDGRRVSVPQKGISVIKTTTSDGQVKTAKVVY